MTPNPNRNTDAILGPERSLPGGGGTRAQLEDGRVQTDDLEVEWEGEPSRAVLSARKREAGATAGRETPAGNSPAPLPFSNARCIALVATLTGASFLNTLSLQLVVIILPTIGDALAIPESRLQWVVSSYSLAFGCFLLLWGRIADIYGKRLIFIAGSVWVTIITAVNPFLPNEIAFDLFRGLHGLGAAANVPTAIGILGVTFPPGKTKNFAFSAYASGAPLGSVFGNLLSGLIANYADWKWVFGAAAMMAGLISIAGFFVIPPPPKTAELPEERSLASVDWIGAVLITGGLFTLLFALTEGNGVGWATPWIPVLIVISLLVIVAFGFWQHYIETRCPGRSPLIKVSLFRNFRFTAVMFIMALSFASFNCFIIFATYYYQDFQDFSPLQTMLRFIPTGVGGAIVAAIVAQLLHWVPTVFIMAAGNISVSVACLLFAVPIPPTTSYFAWGLPAMILSVIGADTAWPSLTLFTSSALPQADQAIGGALINAMGQLGRSIGLAISTAIQTAVMANDRGVSVEDVGAPQPWDPATLHGIRAASWMNFGFGMMSLITVLAAFHTMDIVGRAETPKASEVRKEGIIVEQARPASATDVPKEGTEHRIAS